MEFITENIIWIGLILGSGVMLLWPQLRRGTAGAAEVTPAEAVLLINRENALVLDVRSDAEFASGHIADARNIPLAQLAERIGELRKYQQKPILVNCQSGVRTGSACAQLKKAGFTRVYHLSGGMAAWKKASLPTV